MDYDIDFRRGFVHTDWLDQVDRVSAGGDNGFNARFHTLEADLDVLGERVARINTALNAVRGEIHTGLDVVAGDGAGATSDGLSGFFVFPVPEPNDIRVRLGPGVVGGLPVTPRGARRYRDQPWVDPAVAAAAGVPPIPPLTTPAGNRDDVVYVDVWERAGEPGELVQEVAVRVAEGVTTPPAAQAGHAFLVIAVLHRKPEAAQIVAADIEDRRVFVDRSPALRTLTVQPALLPVANEAAWTQSLFGAEARNAQGSVGGLMSLALPHHARILSLRYRGRHSAAGMSTMVALARLAISGPNAGQFGGFTTLAIDTVTSAGAFDRTVAVENAGNVNLVDTDDFTYFAVADADPGPNVATLYSLTFTYIA
jgi:hypothetical protein